MHESAYGVWRLILRNLASHLSKGLFVVGAASLLLATLCAPSLGNCIAHQPPNMRFTPPRELELKWECTTAGPLYEHARRWYIITLKVTNEGARRVQALKMQADIVDAFGDVLLAVPITENANIGQGNSDGAVFAFHPPFPPNSADHVNFYLLAVRYVDGGVWKSATEPKSGPALGARGALRRFPMRWDTYDIGSEIAPTPSPYPRRSQ